MGRRPILAFACLWLAAGGWAQQRPQVVILLVGPPGSGKGTQAKMITEKYGVPAFSTGDLLRAEVKEGTALGKRIQPVMAQGGLVDDSIVNELVAGRTLKPDAARGFILDGYPRTVAQAQFLDRLLAERRWPRPTVIHLDVPDSVVIERLLQRGRADDKPEVIRGRLKKYESETAPVLKHYSAGDYHRIDGTKAPEAVFAQIETVLRKKMGRKSAGSAGGTARAVRAQTTLGTA